MLIKIAFDLLLPALLIMGWSESEARIQYESTPAYYHYSGVGIAYFDAHNGRMFFSVSGREAVTVDHEFQHGYHWRKWGRFVPDRILMDFTANRGQHPCIDKTMHEQPNDIVHWPHFVINCVQPYRDKYQFPLAFREDYFGWFSWYARSLARIYMPLMLRLVDN